MKPSQKIGPEKTELSNPPFSPSYLETNLDDELEFYLWYIQAGEVCENWNSVASYQIGITLIRKVKVHKEKENIYQ